ncbi:exonuclease SbcCD subunit D [Isoptericola sp. b441]|uniref:Nuclease SbcCD subunit D n=1 Tax=Actinotalea lenta TaxID=3064654 RepID=A0ABT9D5K8_9CELL|nr:MULTISPECIES: exonuclease SbcCD subunit D [unclassified Isoptericola]MDO8106069.1 exonuclease SbcCD subunit D [Isoptericola sp. b441]MDO8122212.1 exonuclease SbcCD subunit D [Isoptericola sp. b490]
MRLVHTSDWHLGRTLHGVGMLEHQATYLDHLVELVRGERVDAVLVSGDVYDRAIPPVEAVELLAHALARLSETATVVLTPGNHDSAIRLGFGAALMRPGVHLRARPDQVGTPVLLDDAVAVYPLPYLDPDGVRDVLGDGEPLPRSHEAVTAAAMDRVRTDLAGRPGMRSVVMAHAFVLGGAASDSERDIRVGGVDSVPAGVFEGVDYVALGHLHGPQRIDGAPGQVVQYSGSPLAYSFSERNHRKSTALVELEASGPPRVELVPAPVPRRLTELVGELELVLAQGGGGLHGQDWVRVVATDDRRPPDLYARVRAAFPHALSVEHRPARTAAPPSVAVTPTRDPVELLAEFVAHVTGAEPDPAELAVLTRAYEAVREPAS